MPKLPSKVVAAIAAGGMTAVIGVIGYFEGYKEKPYYDTGGVLTVCYGHTGNVNPKKTYTNEECVEFLEKDIATAYRVLNKYVKVDLTEDQEIALVSFILNIGEGQFRTSTLLKKLNAGDYVGACNQLPRWVYDNGRKLEWQVHRRDVEKRLCLGEFD